MPPSHVIRTALVTGGSRGLGRALALALARRGAQVVVTGREREQLATVAAEVARCGYPGKALVLDAGDTKASVARIRELDAELGGLDLVVANAGVGMPDPDMTPYGWEALDAAFHVNFCGAAATLTAALPAMVERGRGHLVAISSLASFGPLPGAAAYCAPKAGLAMLAACLRLDLAGSGVAVTTVNLGFVATRMVARSRHAMPQLLTAEGAAARIVAGLARRPATITLPRALAGGAWALARVPVGLKALAMGRRRLG